MPLLAAIVVPPPPGVYGDFAPLAGALVPQNGGAFHRGNGERVEIFDADGALVAARDFVLDDDIQDLKVAALGGLPAGEYTYTVASDDWPGLPLGPFQFTLDEGEDETPPAFAREDFELDVDILEEGGFVISCPAPEVTDDYAVFATLLQPRFLRFESSPSDRLFTVIDDSTQTEADLELVAIDIAGHERAITVTVDLPRHPSLEEEPPRGCAQASAEPPLVAALLCLWSLCRRRRTR
jgi:hypothetical protein